MREIRRGSTMKHPLRTLSQGGYKRLCNYLDKRDGGCIVCGNTYVQHHHVIERSDGRWDDARNMVCLCATHHEMYGKGDRSHKWRDIFFGYLNSDPVKRYDEEHAEELREIYKTAVKEVPW